MTMTVKEAMRDYFDRLLAKCREQGQELPRFSFEQDFEPWIYASAPDECGWAAWRPLEKTERHELSAIAPDLSPFHASIEAYFNSFWFCALEGGLDTFSLSLEAVTPGLEPELFLANARGYAGAHGGRLRHVPIGVELNGLQVVVDNETGAVAIEDWERGTFQEIAASLSELIHELKV